MKQSELLELLNSMSLEEKAMQMTQLVSGLICHTQVANLTGPFRQWEFTDEQLKLTGTVLGSHGAEHVMSVQKQFLENSEKKIPLIFMEDVIHGYATAYPIPLAQGCSFDMELIEEAAYATAKEATAAGVHLTFSPMADLVRDPRWGRVMESPGEDPYVAGLVAAAMVRGYQGEDISNKDRLAACLKHFAGYGQPEGGREYNTVDMSKGVLRDFYLPAYKAAIEAGVEMVMASFNTVDRVPATCSQYLLRKILREEWGFKGTVISDFSAMDEIMNHSVAADKYEAGEKCLKAGMDIEMMSGVYIGSLQKLLDDGAISMEEIDECVLRILELKNRLGLFENPYKGADPELEKELACCDAHRAIARKLAAESMVLLKNEGVLPLAKDIKVGLAGPFAATGDILGAWHCVGRSEDSITLKSAMEEILGDELVCAMTTPFVFPQTCDVPDETEKAVEALKDCDVCVVAVGEPEWETGEATSRTSLRLTPSQEKLIHTLKAAGKKVITVLFTGRPMEILPILEDSDAVLEAWFPGTEGGHAIADVLFGDVNPAGRLTMSFPRNVGQIPVYYNCYNTGRPNVSDDKYSSRYIDCPNDPLYPFGYGLSYTTFVYSGMEVHANGPKDSNGVLTHNLEEGTVKVVVNVKNEGTVAGATLVQLYTRDVSGSVVRPLKELKGFEKIFLQPEEEKTVEFEITKEMLSFYNNDEEFVFEKGLFEIMVGDNAKDVSVEKIYIV